MQNDKPFFTFKLIIDISVALCIGLHALACVCSQSFTVTATALLNDDEYDNKRTLQMQRTACSV